MTTQTDAGTSDRKVVTIERISEESDILHFTLSNINTSIANGLRRTILSDIPTLVFHTFPYSENDVNISKNTTKFNNEIIKQRLSCIPIHALHDGYPYKNYEFTIDKTNSGNKVEYVTTNDFVFNNPSPTHAEISKIFPLDTITKDPIIIARLLPQMAKNIHGETLKLSAKASFHTASENGSYNVVSCCTYKCTPDKNKQDAAYVEYAKLNASDTKRNDWKNLQAYRYYIKNSFDFMIESLGVYNNRDVVKMGCSVLIKRLDVLIDTGVGIILPNSNSTIPNSYDIKLDGIGYTIGKVLEYLLNSEYYTRLGTLSYVGFRKTHPHDTYSIIRIGFHDESDAKVDNIKEMLKTATRTAINIYTQISDKLPD
jgi:DNA-directed RNA polymerase II subunit RPB3